MTNTLISPTEIQHLNNSIYTIIGTSVAGVDNYVGPIVACSVCLDYFNLPKHLERFINNEKLTSEELKEFMSDLCISTIYVVEPAVINTIRDIELAEDMAKFNSTNKLVWDMLLKRIVPEVYITSDKPLIEVVDTSTDSVRAENKDRYVRWTSHHSIELITPKAEFLTAPWTDSLCTKVAHRLSELAVRGRLKNLDKEIPNYQILRFTGKEQEQFVSKYGNTVHHRVFLPELKKYPIGRLIND